MRRSLRPLACCHGEGASMLAPLPALGSALPSLCVCSALLQRQALALQGPLRVSPLVVGLLRQLWLAHLPHTGVTDPGFRRWAARGWGWGRGWVRGRLVPYVGLCVWLWTMLAPPLKVRGPVPLPTGRKWTWGRGTREPRKRSAATPLPAELSFLPSFPSLSSSQAAGGAHPTERGGRGGGRGGGRRAGPGGAGCPGAQPAAGAGRGAGQGGQQRGKTFSSFCVRNKKNPLPLG